jgi:DNA-binding transcriptional LysR family regulator
MRGVLIQQSHTPLVDGNGSRSWRAPAGAILLRRHRKTDLLPPFLERHPNLTINLSLSDYMVDLVAQRTDVAIRMGNLPDSS